jgi:hypothetical protein
VPVGVCAMRELAMAKTSTSGKATRNMGASERCDVYDRRDGCGAVDRIFYTHAT